MASSLRTATGPQPEFISRRPPFQRIAFEDFSASGPKGGWPITDARSSPKKTSTSAPRVYNGLQRPTFTSLDPFQMHKPSSRHGQRRAAHPLSSSLQLPPRSSPGYRTETRESVPGLGQGTARLRTAQHNPTSSSSDPRVRAMMAVKEGQLGEVRFYVLESFTAISYQVSLPTDG